MQAFIALGANLGDAIATIEAAARRLHGLPGTRLVRLSSLYASAPVDATGPDFINAVAEIDTALAPHALLDALQAIEADHGRQRPYRNAPRTLDLDLLLHAGASQLEDARLTLPHPRMRERAFVLHPLAEIAPMLVADAELAHVAQQRIRRLER